MKSLFYAIGLTVGCFACTTSFANSFQQWQQGGINIGDYAAGAAAIADNTTAYYNPAGTTRTKHQDIAFSVLGSVSFIKYDGTSTVGKSITNFNNAGVAQGGSSNVIPTILYVAPLNDHWGFGFSMASPYNAYVNYGRNEFTRYATTESIIRTIDLSPSVAYKFFNRFSIGFGADAERFKLEYDRIDTTASTANEGAVTTKMSDWSFGWNTGILWEVTNNIRLGASYHSKMVHHAFGNSRFYGTGVGGSRAKVDAYLPPLAILSAYYQLNSTLSLMGTASYTQWKELRDLTISNMAGADFTRVTLQNPANNAWRFALGAHYQLNSKLLLTSALGFDESANNNTSRNIIFPDADQYIVSLGMGYQITKTIGLNLGYAHTFPEHTSIAHAQNYGHTTMTNTGTLSQNADLFGIQINWLMT